jgi:hypothetical protein
MDDRSSKPKKYNLKKSPDDKRGGDRHGMIPDPNQITFSVVQQATGQIPKIEPPKAPEKNPAAVTLGRLGGLKGGKARAESLTPAKRKAIAKKAAEARWKKT